MKTKFLIQTLSAMLATYLLYQAGWGFNVLLLSLLVLGLLLAFQKPALFPAMLFLAAALLFAISGSLLAMVLFWLLLLLLLALSQNHLSWPVALLDGLQKLLNGGWRMLLQQKQLPIRGFTLGKSMLLSLPPLFITLLFYALYAKANPVFADRITLAHLHLPKASWFLLFFLMLYLSYALVYALPHSSLQAWDSRQPDVLLRRRKKSSFNPLWLKYEYKTALIALVLLNTLLLLFHSVDVATLLEGRPAQGVTYAEWVHQGVGTLIISIVMAVALLIWVFRGNLNFFTHNQPLRLLARAWIIQNVLLVLSTALKNSWYIASWGLTYKRIGVWVYLLLVLIGLITTWSKISHKHTLWWMIKGNLRAALLVLLLTASLPWARLISWYNLEQAKVQDVAYLMELPLHTTDQLLAHQHLLSDGQLLQLEDRRARLLESTKTNNWKNWTLLNHYAAQNLSNTR